MSWLRKGRQTEQFEEDSGDRREPLYVPASQRRRPIPEVAIVELPDGAPDEQVEFLAGLVQQIDTEQTTAAPARAASTRFSRRTMDMEVEDDELWAFHETTIPVDRHEGLRKYTEHDVEMDELIDDLALTMAALRLRRAA